MKTTLTGIINELKTLSNAQDKVSKSINFVNSEIQKILNPKNIYDKDQHGLLVFLTTYKHSIYYWEN